MKEDQFVQHFDALGESFKRFLNEAFEYSPNSTLPGTQPLAVAMQHQGNEEDPITQNFKNSSSQEFNGSVLRQTLFAVMGISVVIMTVFIIALIVYRRKSKNGLKSMQERMDILELGVAAECKDAFVELQTDMTDLRKALASGAGIPFLSYGTYAMRILFPNMDDPTVLQMQIPELLRKEKGLRLFEELIMNQTFLLLFIRTLESKRSFPIRDRARVASLVMLILQGHMEYCTGILKFLLEDLIEKCMKEKGHPKLLLRSTESIAEKMLGSWFALLLYPLLREGAGNPLFFLIKAIKQQIDKGPVDAITSEVRYCLSEEILIRQAIDFKPMTVYVSILQHAVVGDIDPNTANVSVKVLDCDTISQVKEKALDTIYRATPYSKRPSKYNFALVWKTGTSGKLILYDEDSTTEIEGDWKKRNTLRHYRVPDGAFLNLESGRSLIPDHSVLSEKNANKTLTLSKLSSSSPVLSLETSTLDNDHYQRRRIWHLVKNDGSDTHEEGERGMVSEIYLTRLLATKGTLQTFVDNLFEAIFSSDHNDSALQLGVKYIFDFLDKQALQHEVSDPDIVHAWKSNALPLRVWLNLIKQPYFIFDIQRSHIVDTCLSVVAKTFKKSCFTDDYMLEKHLSYNLLHTKDIPKYRELVERYYSEIESRNAISEQDMNVIVAQQSRFYGGEFSTLCALDDLYVYAAQYKRDLMTTLTEDTLSAKQLLRYKFEEVCNIMEIQEQ